MFGGARKETEVVAGHEKVGAVGAPADFAAILTVAECLQRQSALEEEDEIRIIVP